MADNYQHQPELEMSSPHATTQGGNQVELQTTDLPMRAIQTMEELAKVLTQFCTTTSGKKHLHHISPPCRIAKQFSFLLVAIFPSSVILSFQFLPPYFWTYTATTPCQQGAIHSSYTDHPQVAVANHTATTPGQWKP